MKSKSYIFIFVLIFMMVFSFSAVSADDLQTAESDVVSGDVDIETANPGTTSGNLTYDIPVDADIKKADLYINVYSGSAQNTYGANANVSLKTINGESQIASEELWTEDGSTDGTIYNVNDHINKCYSDYQMYYDITDSLKGLNGSAITLKVDTFKMDEKQFDGRIKLIALIVAYDDGDDDAVHYFVDSTQKWTKTNITTTFSTENLAEIENAELTNIALSSGDGSYKINGEFLGDADIHSTGNGFYYQYNKWNVTDNLKEGSQTEFVSSYAGTSSYGSLKNVLSVLKVNSMQTDVSFATEYTSVNTCYAGTNNTLTINVNSNRAGKFTVELLADGNVVNSTEIELDGENASTFLLTDPTLRDLDETTVNGANNTNVVYTVNVNYGNITVDSESKTLPVLYNGNLGYDMEYGIDGFEALTSIVITGDVVIDIKNVSSYLGAAAMNRTDVWAVDLTDKEIVSGYLFVPYNWFNARTYTEDIDMFNMTFNDASLAPVAYYRDQGNLGNYGKYGYGVLIYDVSDLIADGDNTLILNKVNPTPAVYPSVLVYMYNADGGSLKEVSIVAAADLLANSYNNAGRVVKTDSQIDISVEDVANATLYVLAASAQAGESNIVFNGDVYENVWSGTSSTTDLYVLDITDSVAQSNNVSFVATGSTILALPQIIVADTGVAASIDSIKTEYTSVATAYAGTNNTLTVAVSSLNEGKYIINLYADDELVDSIEVNLTNGTNTVLLTDPTVRPVDETTVNGANNTKVTYEVTVNYNDIEVASKNITVPVLYNGNLGKDLEYNAVYIEDSSVYEITGFMGMYSKDASSYLAAGATNRTDVFIITLNDTQTFEKAFIYVAYNWDKTGVNGPVFNTTFNGQVVSPKASYRDQSNLGNYGKYGYGLFVYDVTDLAVNGENTFVLNKESGLTAVYPTSFIYLINDTESDYKITVYMGDGADLLANSNNNAGRIVKTDSTFEDVATDNVVYANLFVYAASAQAGEGNIVINDEEFTDVWKGTSNTVEVFESDLMDMLKSDNEVSFVATGSTILALNQIVVVATVEKQEPAEMTIDIPQAVAGDDLTITITVANATGNVSVSSDAAEAQIIALDENGTATFTIPNVAAGTHYISANYDGDSKFTSASQIELFDVAKQTAEANITTPVDFKVGEDVNVTVDIPGATGNVSVIVDGVEKVVPLVNGTAVVPIENLTAGEHSVVVVYDGDDTYAPFHQVATFDAPQMDTRFDDLTVDGSGLIDGVLVNAMGDVLANKTITYTVNGVQATTTTDENGFFAFNATSPATVEIAYVGDDFYLPSNITIKLNDLAPVRQATIINGNNFTQYAIEYSAGERGGNFTVKLVDEMGNPIVNKTVLIGYNGKTLERVTNETGDATVQINLRDANRLTFATTFLGDKDYNATMSVYLITIVKKPVTITAPAKLYKASTKTKSYTVTLKSIKGASADGKTYFAAGKKVTLKVNGKTYTAKINAKGQVTFKITNLKKKGTFTAKVSYAGDTTYNAVSKSVKLTIK